MNRLAIDPAPSEEEAAAIFAVLEQLGEQPSATTPETVSRWRLAARAIRGRTGADAPKSSGWAQAGRHYE